MNGRGEKNVVVLIGNGFDLGVGMPTKWSDYQQWLTFQNENLQNNRLVEFLNKNEKMGFDHWADVEAALPIFLDGANGPEDRKNASKAVDEFSENFEVYLESLDNSGKYSRASDTKVFMDGLEKMLEKVQEHSDLKNQKLGKIKSNNVGVKQEMIFSFLNFNYTSTLYNIIQKATVDEYFDTGRRFIHNNSWSIPYIGTSASLHVHGSIHNELESIVIGVDNVSQLPTYIDFEEKSGRVIKDCMVKSEIIEKSTSLWQPYQKAKELIADADIIIVYGLSLGTSDACWAECVLQSRVDSLESNYEEKSDKKDVFFFNYKKTQGSRSNRTELSEAKYEILDRFSSNLDYAEDIVQIIHTDSIWQFKKYADKK